MSYHYNVAMSQYTPTVHRDKSGRCTINWNTPDDDMPTDGAIAVAPELIAEWVRTCNALADAERLLGMRP